jgi:hypothetical protein
MIIDIFMPHMRGFESIRVFHERAPGIPLIAMSGYAFANLNSPAPDFLGWRWSSARRAACASRSRPMHCSRPSRLASPEHRAVASAAPGLSREARGGRGKRRLPQTQVARFRPGTRRRPTQAISIAGIRFNSRDPSRSPSASCIFCACRDGVIGRLLVAFPESCRFAAAQTQTRSRIASFAPVSVVSTEDEINGTVKWVV